LDYGANPSNGNNPSTGANPSAPTYPTIGVATFNLYQRNLILDEIAKRRKAPANTNQSVKKLSYIKP
jgi:hypothetical protein